MALHHHLDLAVLRQAGFNVAPGTETQVALNPILIETTSIAKTRFGPDDRDCYFQSEISLKHWTYRFVDSSDPSARSEGGRYSMGNCMLEAALQVKWESLLLSQLIS